MNLVDCYVTKVVSEPYQEYGKWWVKVEANAYGRPSKSTLMFDTKEEAIKVDVGHHFLA